MDSASFVLTSLGILFIMQLITLALVISVKKAVSKEEERKEKVATPSFNHQKKDRPFRQEKRPESRPPSVSQPRQPDSTADKSLREINLRLRNAERDQERARKIIDSSAQSIGNQKHSDNRQRSRDFSRDRSNRDNRDRGRDRGRDRPRDWQQRERQPQKSSEPSASAPPRPETLPSPQPPAAEPAQQQAVFEPSTAAESMEHGRKITVKRRMLNNGETENGQGQGEEASLEQRPEPAQASQLNSPVPSENAEPDGQKSEISYGRR